MAKQDVIKHYKTQGHQDRAISLKSQSKLNFGMPNSDREVTMRTEAEVRMAVLTASCNIPLAFHDKLSPALRSAFCDSKIASKYHSASIKAMCMLNIAVAPTLIQDLLENMKCHPFSLSVDGSNDTGIDKMNPLTIRIFDVNSGRVVTQFLDMCTSVSSTSEALYAVIDGRLSELLVSANPWDMCTSVGVDNTSVNIGIRNSLKTRILRRNGVIFFNGCPCHIIHNAAQKAGSAFALCCGFDVE